MLKMVDGTGIIGVDMICPLGVSTPQPPNYDRVELEGAGMLVLPNSLDAPLERLELGGKTEQVTTTGAQLFDKENLVVGVLEYDGSIAYINNYYTSDYIAVEPNTKYICTRTGSKRLKFYSADKQPIQTVSFSDANVEQGGSFTTRETTKYVRFSVVGDYINTVMFTSGVSFLPYEPYTGGKPSPSPEYQQEIKSVGRLNEDTGKYEVDVKVTNAEQNWSKEQTLTLTSDRPITKWDRLVEQGGQIGWLYGAKRYVVTGSELWIFAGAQYYSGISTSMYANAVTNVEQAAVCERLKYEGVIWNKDDKQGFCLNNTNQLHIRFFNEILGVADEATKEEKQKAYVTYLKSEYEKGTPYEIVYKSTATEFVPLPQSEQNAIRALKTYYPTTVITADGGELDPDIKVTYRKEI